MKFIIEKGYVSNVDFKEFKREDGTSFKIGKLCVREGSYDEETQYAKSVLHFIDFDYDKFDEVKKFVDHNVSCEGEVIRSFKSNSDNSKTYFTNFKLSDIEEV